MMPVFNPEKILFTPDALNERGRQITSQYPGAEQVAIKQHNKPPDIDISHYKAKSDLLILGRLKTQDCKWSGRSSDYIAPSLANGCFGGCAYCYVDRHKKINPITIFTNVDENMATVDKHVMSLDWPKIPNQTDPVFWTYDIGCNSDVSVDYGISPSMADVFRFYRDHPRAKATFATKFVNRDMLSFDPKRKIRIRFSLMPSHISRLVDVRTDPIETRLQAINDFYDAGYDVHVNFSPVIIYNRFKGEERFWLNDYRELFRQLDTVTRADVKAQMKCEVIFLTHNAGQHLANMQINPVAEELLWVPEMQESKKSSFGGENIRYEHSFKSRMIESFKSCLQQEIPWCGIRYIF
jgi:spore photoproduct lyase